MVHRCTLVFTVVKLTNSNRAYINQELDKLDLTQPKRITISDWKEKRGLSSNGLQHLWYGILNKHFGYFQDKHQNPAKEMCKVMFGVPIILNNPNYGQLISDNFDSIGFWGKAFDEQCQIVRIIQITSLFDTSESKEYMDQIVFYFADKGVEIKYRD